jgi:hypothetical protein
MGIQHGGDPALKSLISTSIEPLLRLRSKGLIQIDYSAFRKKQKVTDSTLTLTAWTVYSVLGTKVITGMLVFKSPKLGVRTSGHYN